MPQIAECDLPIVNGRLPDGRFAPKNTICDLSDRGKGYAKISTRIAHIVNNKKLNEITAITGNPEQFGELKAAEAIAYRRVAEAAIGDRADAEFILDRLEGKATNKTELTGKDGNPLAIATADVTGLLSEISEKIGE